MSTAKSPALRVDNRRLIAIDCETNGLYGDTRILSLAMAELRRGIVAETRMWLLDPGNVYLEPAAMAVNGLTAEHLAGAESFVEVADEVREWLSAPEGQRLTLVGHKVSFDARQLLGEFTRLGEQLPSLDLLDTAKLAEAARVLPLDRSLAGLLCALNLASAAPHTALGDTTAVAAATIELLGRLARQHGPAQLPGVLDGLVVEFQPSEANPLPHRAEPDIPLSERHLAAHLTNLSDGRRRRAALDVCLEEDCPILATRMEDGIVTKAHAEQVIEWAFEHLGETKMRRSTKGKLLRGVGQALRRLEDPELTVWVYRTRLNPYLATARRCTKRSRCERCDAGLGVCDFDDVLRRCVDAVIHDRFDPFAKPALDQVEAFLPGYDPSVARGRGRPPEGFYGELRRDGHLDAAGHGVARVAEVRRTQGGRDWAYALLRKGWNDGCRTPRMVELLASMTVVDAIGAEQDDGTFAPKAPLELAIYYIDECLAAYPGQKARIFTRLEKRRERIDGLLASEPRAPRDFDKAVNLRPAHRATLGRAPKQASRERRQTNPGAYRPVTVRSARRGSRG